jgi:hypothetical protein
LSTQEIFMPAASPVCLPQRLIWLRVVLSDRFGSDVADRFRRRLSAYLARTGIAPVMSATRIVLLASNRSITSFDVSMVVAWLVEQPEVVMVCRQSPPVKNRRAHG